jgi:hypothetical protein
VGDYFLESPQVFHVGSLDQPPSIYPGYPRKQRVHSDKHVNSRLLSKLCNLKDTDVDEFTTGHNYNTLFSQSHG